MTAPQGRDREDFDGPEWGDSEWSSEAEATGGFGSVDGSASTESWLDRLTDDDAQPEHATSLAQWEGDAGTLNPAQRKTLVTLLKNRFITADKSPAEWRVSLESEPLLRSRLNDLFLDLHLDRARGVAFKRQAVSDSGDKFPTLLYDTSWGREETILVIFLRTRFRSERAEGAEDVIVDRDELLERVTQFRPAHATDVAGDTRKTEHAIDALRRAGILHRTSDEQRLKVSPVIEVLLPVEKLQQLLDWFLTHDDPDASSERGADASSPYLSLDRDEGIKPSDSATGESGEADR
jgi:hypothetical protein